MNQTPGTTTTADTFILAGKTDDGVWRKVETVAREEGESAEDVKAFLQTMAHAHSRNYLALDILTEAEFAQRAAA